MSSYLSIPEKEWASALRGLGSIIFKEWRVTWTFSYTDNRYSNNQN
jgi:hypothetical protein